jgi:hypothetical protein
MFFVSRRQYQSIYDRIDPSGFSRPHGVCATVIGGEEESPGCIRFRFEDRSVALLFQKHSGTFDRRSGGVLNTAFDSDRKVRGRVLLESCRAWQTHERGNQCGESRTSRVPCSSGRDRQFVPAIYHEGRILAAHPPPGANLIFSFVALLT